MKRERLSELLAIKDQIGGKMDTFIIPAVEGLNTLGFQTYFSCQGHESTHPVDSNEKYPFILVNLIKNTPKDALRLEYLVAFFNKQVLQEQQVSVDIKLSVGLAEINFGDKRRGPKGKGERLFQSQLDSIRFGIFCRSIRLGYKEAKNVRDILILAPFRDFSVPERYRQKMIKSSRDFKTDYDYLMRFLSPSSLSFEMINSGIGL
jgi:hypothetical protein